MRTIIYTCAILLLLPVSVLADTDAAELATIEISEWKVPWEATRPRDPDIAPDGSIWLVGQGGHYAAHFDPDTEAFNHHDMPDEAGPHNLIVAGDGTIWYAGNKKGYIGEMNPESGEVVMHPMPDPAVKDPHTLVFDNDENIWFTAQWANKVGYLDTDTGKVQLIDVPTEKARPYGIKMAPDGTPWVVLLGTNKLARIDPQAKTLEEIEIPIESVRPRRLAITSDGDIWYGDYATGYLGQYQPDSGEFQHWRSPAGEDSGLYAFGVDSQDRLWMVETKPEPNTFVGFDPEANEFISSTPVPSGAGAVRHMVYDAERNGFWFGTDTNNLGFAALAGVSGNANAGGSNSD